MNSEAQGQKTILVPTLALESLVLGESGHRIVRTLKQPHGETHVERNRLPANS